MSAIILATFNARYQHAAFGLRYLLANLGELRAEAALLEFDLQRNPEAAAEQILAHQPRVVGVAVYIWNVRQTAELLATLRRRAPGVKLVLGGPEVSYETETHPLAPLADFVICGEADLVFADLCRAVLAGQPPHEKILRPPPPDPAQLALPYEFYSDHDLATRFAYLEASRGCPFGCEYCVSAIDRGVRRFDWTRLQPEFERLLARGARRIKFVDRTFNLDLELGRAVLEFFYARAVTGVQVHIEITPSCLTEAWRELLRRAPPGLLRLEVGVQTFDETISAQIGRPQSAAQAEDALRFLRTETNVLIHADLIAGLPGQTLEMFAADFDRMVALQPHEIQVGILKRLRGTAIGRHDAEWGVRWNTEPPYDILENKLLDAATVTQLKRFARCWEILGNRGRFEQTLPLLWSAPGDSPFSKVWKFTEQLFPRFGKLHGIPLLDFARALFDFMADFQGLEKPRIAAALRADLARSGAPHLPKWVREI
ncbi:MAG: DUF4080 domain-containing protein [Verrucomicrobia bacterium]|nr:MAG: DUF4080 domain-containing protein [Verrucomicrobiota bacterium]